MTTTNMLEIAENALRGMGRTGDDRIALFPDEAAAIAAELDRLRAENARLSAELEATRETRSSHEAAHTRLGHELSTGGYGASISEIAADEAIRILREQRSENERLEALFQKTHGVHSSWVAEVGRLAGELTNAKATIEALKSDVARLRELCSKAAGWLNAAPLPKKSCRAEFHCMIAQLTAAGGK